MRRLLVLALLVASCSPMSVATRLLMASGGGASYLAPSTPPFDNAWGAGHPAVFNVHGEPSAIFEGGIFRLWSGSYAPDAAHPGLEYSTSTDGLTWTLVGNVLGQGAGGVAGDVLRGTVVKLGSTYYATYSAAGTDPNRDLAIATSSDGSTWSYVGVLVAHNAVSGVEGWANSTMFLDGSTYYLMIEGHNTAISQWVIYLFSATSPLGPFSVLNGGNRLSTLEQVVNGSTGGPTVTVINTTPTPKFGGVYHLWAHCQSTGSAIPTPTYHFTSTDLINWTTTSPNPVFTGLPQAGTSPAWDQTSDPAVLVVPGTGAFLFVGGGNNIDFSNNGIVTATAPATP
ncbi:MAG TPA: hypothetical protein VIM25_01290 [Candidatus Limnocylindrales bacterium]